MIEFFSIFHFPHRYNQTGKMEEKSNFLNNFQANTKREIISMIPRMTFPMERRRVAQVSEKVNISLISSVQFTICPLIFIIVELMIGEPNDSYDYSSSINEASSCLAIIISIASLITARLLNWLGQPFQMTLWREKLLVKVFHKCLNV